MDAVIGLTVALPAWNSKEICWLAMEGLCRQQPADGFAWELLVCEERHDGQLGRAFFDGYTGRLGDCGCARLTYIEAPRWIPLPRKWQTMGRAMHPTSKVFVLQAADCYSFPQRLNVSYRKVALDGVTWYDVSRGWFYSIRSRKVIQYKFVNPTRTHLNMAFSDAAARTIPDSCLRKNIDGFLFSHCRSTVPGFNRYVDTAEYIGLDTNGHNNISVGRESHFTQPQPPLYAATVELGGLGLPADIVDRLKEMKPRT